jgi:hypothetical protein
MHPTVELLTQVMRPPLRGGDQVDWEAWRAELGFDFPSDYKSFIEVYGGGTIDLFLDIISLDDGGSDWRDEYENGPYMFYEDERGNSIPCPYPVKNGQGGLVFWGISAGPEFCFWYANDDDPDNWPVVVWERHTWRWTQHDAGFASYFLELFNGRIESPFSDGFPSAKPDYLNRHDEKMMNTAGVYANHYYDGNEHQFIAEMRAASLDPLEFFPSLADFL